MIECLDGLVGLTDSKCPCIDEADATADGISNASSSGFYVTHEMNNIIPMLASANCGDGGIWDVLNRARAKAFLDISLNLKQALYRGFNSRLRRFSGNVGFSKATNTYRDIKAHAGQSWSIGRVRSGYLTISDVTLGLDTDAAVDVVIWSDDYTNPLATVTVNAVADTYVTQALATPLEIDLKTTQTIRIGYERPGTARALANKLTCGCGGEELIWDKYMSASGYETSSAPTTSNLQGTGSHANGLQINATFECRSMNFLCDLDSIDGYVTKEVFAKMVVYGSAYHAYNMMVQSGNVNFFTLVTKEQMYKSRSHTNKQFGELIEFIASEIPMDINDCFTCKPSKGLTKAAIMV